MLSSEGSTAISCRVVNSGVLCQVTQECYRMTDTLTRTAFSVSCHSDARGKIVLAFSVRR